MKLFLFLWLLPCAILAQTINDDFRAITQADLLKTVYEPDSSANAVILYDQAIITLDLSWTTIRHYRRVKLYKKQGYEYGNIEVENFVGGSVQQIKAVTHHFDPQLKRLVTIEMADNAIMSQRVNKWTEKTTFLLPNLIEGAIFEYSYVQKLPARLLGKWWFQHNVPVEYSECRLNGGVKYDSRVTGSLPPPKYTDKFKLSFQRWEMRNIPSFKKEPFMVDESLYRSGIGFTYPSRTWGHVIVDIDTDPNFGGVINDYYTKKITNTVIEGLQTESEKIRAISEYVKKEVAWNGEYHFLAGLPRNVLTEKKGTSGDINLLMASMLKKAGINFVMVATSTRGNGAIDKLYPSASEFDHVMCLVMSEDTVLLDATDKFLPYNVVPAECLNQDGLIIADKDYGWITLRPVLKDKLTAQANVTMDDEGLIKGSVTFTHEGYAARDARMMFAASGKDEYIRNISRSHDLLVTTSSFKDDGLDKSFQETHEISISGKAEAQGDRIYFSPFLFFQIDKNYFVDEHRTYPIQFGVPEEKMFIAEIAVPNGYEVEQIPAGKMLNMSGNTVRYLLNCEHRQGKIVITTKLERKKEVYELEEYTALREFFNRLVAKNAEMVVLVKKKP